MIRKSHHPVVVQVLRDHLDGLADVRSGWDLSIQQRTRLAKRFELDRHEVVLAVAERKLIVGLKHTWLVATPNRVIVHDLPWQVRHHAWSDPFVAFEFMPDRDPQDRAFRRAFGEIKEDCWTPEPRHPELERRIVASPTSRELRAVYLDWLYSMGAPRGRLGRLEPSSDAFRELVSRYRWALGVHHTADVASFEWKGGFWDEARLFASPHTGDHALLHRLLRHPSARFLRSIHLGPQRRLDEHEAEEVGMLVVMNKELWTPECLPMLEALHIGGKRVPRHQLPPS